MDKQPTSTEITGAGTGKVDYNGDITATSIKDLGVGPEVLDRKTNFRLKLRADALVLPLITMCSVIALLDKNALSFASIFGMKDDLNLQGQQYSWLGSLPYFGYALAQFPLGWLLVKLPLAKFAGGVVLMWGVLVCSIVACNSFASVAAIRFLLGLFEAAIVPINMILMGLWYRREEQPLRTAIWYNTLAGVLGGIFAYAISRLDSPYPTWKLLFLIYGSVSLFLGAAVLLIMPDHPSKAWFYNQEDRKNMVVRIAVNQTGQNNKSTFKLNQIIEALCEPRYWVIALYVLSYGIINSGNTNFNALIIAGFGYDAERTSLLAAPQAAVATFFQIVASVTASYVPHVRCLLWTLSTIPGLVGAILIRTLDPDTQRGGALAGVYLLGFYNVSFVMCMSLVSSNNAGATKRSFASTSLSLLYAVGNIIGPQLFLESQAPTYPLGIYAIMTAFAVQGVCGVVYFMLCFFENKRRDREHGKVEHQAIAGLEASEHDMTDGENTAFRYVL